MKTANVKKLLGCMVKDGEVIRARVGSYAIPYRKP
jgi:hypothetical protein